MGINIFSFSFFSPMLAGVMACLILMVKENLNNEPNISCSKLVTVFVVAVGISLLVSLGVSFIKSEHYDLIKVVECLGSSMGASIFVSTERKPLAFSIGYKMSLATNLPKKGFNIASGYNSVFGFWYGDSNKSKVTFTKGTTEVSLINSSTNDGSNGVIYVPVSSNDSSPSSRASSSSDSDGGVTVSPGSDGGVSVLQLHYVHYNDTGLTNHDSIKRGYFPGSITSSISDSEVQYSSFSIFKNNPPLYYSHQRELIK